MTFGSSLLQVLTGTRSIVPPEKKPCRYRAESPRLEYASANPLHGTVLNSIMLSRDTYYCPKVDFERASVTFCPYMWLKLRPTMPASPHGGRSSVYPSRDYLRVGGEGTLPFCDGVFLQDSFLVMSCSLLSLTAFDCVGTLTCPS